MQPLVLKLLKRLLARRILAGPFRGMRYQSTAHASTLMPKVLGTYECELHDALSVLLNRAKTTIVDIGAAEGYYAVGFLYANPNVRVIAYESNEDARNHLARLAALNAVSDRLLIRGHCSIEELETCLHQHDVEFLLMDIEGYELSLLNPAILPTLSTTPIIVEVHDIFVPGVEAALRERFAHTHQLIHIAARMRHPVSIQHPLFRLLAQSSPAIAQRLLWERPEGMSWLVMAPLASSLAAHLSSLSSPLPHN